jgi:hypothetical protein
MSIAPIHRDTRGEQPMVPPHLLKRILAKLDQRKAKPQAEPERDAWANIDRLAETMEAASQ